MKKRQLICDRYQQLSVAGTGAYSVVHVAWDPVIQRKVAIKEISLVRPHAAPEAAAQPAVAQENGADFPKSAAISEAPTQVVSHETEIPLPWNDVPELPSINLPPWENPWQESDAGETLAVGNSRTARTVDYYGEEETQIIAGIPSEDLARTQVIGATRETDAAETQLLDRQTAAATKRLAAVDDPLTCYVSPPVVARKETGTQMFDPHAEYEDELSSQGARTVRADDSSEAFSESDFVYDSIPGLTEARTAALLNDPNIVSVYDFVLKGDSAYLIMEYVEGLTLSELIARYNDRITLDVIAAVVESVGRALGVAHENGVMHLDIKPANILISAEGQVKVTDFGMSKLSDASGQGTAEGGTIGYMPPEQIGSRKADVRTDEWAFASVVYEMLAGYNPFRTKELDNAQAAIENAELLLPSLCWDYADEEIDDVILDALSPDPDERYSDAVSFADALLPLLGDPQVGYDELALMVRDELPEEEADEDDSLGETVAWVPLGAPLPEWASPKVRNVSGRLVAAAGAFLPSFIASSAVFFAAKLPEGYFWIPAVALAAVAAAVPQAGSIIAYVALAVLFACSGAPVLAVGLAALAGAWWFFVGKTDVASSNSGASAMLAGGAGLAPVSPLVAGMCLKPVPAMATALLAAITAICLASLGSMTLFSWDVASAFDCARYGLRWGDVQANALTIAMRPHVQAVALSWVAAAGAFSSFRLRRTRAFAVAGAVAGGVLLVLGTVAASWLLSDGASFLPEAWRLALCFFSTLLALVACAFVQDEPSGRLGPNHSDSDHPDDRLLQEKTDAGF